jgi:hypothetical protein
MVELERAVVALVTAMRPSAPDGKYERVFARRSAERSPVAKLAA